MSATLPGLLRALAEGFAGPDGFPRLGLEAAAEAVWSTPVLKEALRRLLDAEVRSWTETWTDHFLLSRDHPVLHLEASVHRTGLLRDPALLHDLDLHYAALGFDGPVGRSPDHLATELEALAAGLERLRVADNAELEHLVPNLASLVDLHLQPLVGELIRLARTRPCHTAVTAALAAAASTVDLVRDGIYAFT